MKKKFVLFICYFFYIFFVLYGQWIEIETGIEDENFYAVQFFSKDSGYILGERFFLRTHDGGVTWNIYQFPTQQKLRDMFFLDKKFGYACGDRVILKTRSGGMTWNIVHYAEGVFPAVYTSMYFHNFDTGLVVGKCFPRILLTTNGGQNWNCQFNSNLEIAYLTSIHFPSEKIGYAVGIELYHGLGIEEYNAECIKTIDGGETWNMTDNSSFIDIVKFDDFYPHVVFFINSLKGFIGGEKDKCDVIPSAPYCDKRLYVTIDGGKTWDSVATNPLGTVRDIFFLDENIGYLVDELGHIYKSTDGGIHWHVQYYAGKPLYSIYCVDEHTCYAVGANGLVLKTSTAGTTSDIQQTYVFYVRPNPFKEFTEIVFCFYSHTGGRCEQGPATKARLYITTLYGITIKELFNGHITEGMHSIKLNTSDLASGLYFCILETDSDRQVVKLVKQ